MTDQATRLGAVPAAVGGRSPSTRTPGAESPESGPCQPAAGPGGRFADAPTGSAYLFFCWRMSPEQGALDHPRGPEHELLDRPSWLDWIDPHPEPRGGWSAAGEIEEAR